MNIIQVGKILLLAAIALALVSAITGFGTAALMGAQGMERLTGKVELPMAAGQTAAAGAFDALWDMPVGSAAKNTMLYYLKVFVGFMVSLGALSLTWRIYQFFNQAS